MKLFLLFMWFYGYTPYTTPWYWWLFFVMSFILIIWDSYKEVQKRRKQEKINEKVDLMYFYHKDKIDNIINNKK